MKPSPYFLLLFATLGPIAHAETLHGTLVDEKGNPLAGVALSGDWRRLVEGERPRLQPLRAVTDAAGAFTLENAPAIPSADAPLPLIARLAKDRFTVVRLNGEGTRVVAKAEGTDVRFRAVDGKGKPIQGAAVVIRSINVFGEPKGEVRYAARYAGKEPVATTDAKGEAVLPALPNGAFVEYALSAEGIGTRNGRLDVSPATSEVQVAVVQNGILAGRVLRDGQPVAGIRVTALTQSGNVLEASTGVTDADGAYRIKNVIPGVVSLTIRDGESLKDWTCKGYSALQVEEGKELNGLNLVLEKGIALSGRVITRQGGVPVAGAQISVRGEEGSARQLETDAEGRFSTWAMAGSVYVAVDSVKGGRLNRSVSQRVTIDEENSPALELRIPDSVVAKPIEHLAGTVAGPDGKPVAGATVTNLSGGTAFSDAEGKFRFDTPTQPGAWLIAAKDARVSAQPIEAKAEGVVLALSARSIRLSGRILDESGKGMPNVEVTLSGKLGEEYYGGQRAMTDAKGAYVFDRLYGGLDEYFLWAKKAKYGGATIQSIRTKPSEDQKLQDLKLALADGVIEGRVLDADGNPAKGVRVSAQAQESAPILTDDQGRFRLTNVPRGRRALVAGRGSTSEAVADAATGQKDVTIRLDPPRPQTAAGVVLGDRTGMAAPPFKVEKWTGQAVDLAALKGKIVVIDFWAVWCGPCVASLPDVQRLNETYGKQGVVVIGIHTPGTPWDKIAAFIKEKGLTYANGLDSSEKTGMGATSLAFGPSGIPHLFVIDRAGKIVADTHEVADVERMVKKLLER